MNTRLIIAILIALFCSCTNKSTNNSVKSLNRAKEEVKGLLEVYQTQKDEKDLDKAMFYLDSLLDAGVHDKEIYQQKGQILRIRKNYHEFAVMMEESTKHFSNNPQSFFGAGLAYEKAGMQEKAMLQYKKSIEVYDQLLDKYPSLTNYINRAMSVSFYNSKEEGIKSFELIKETGLFDSTEVNCFKPMFYRFNREQYVEDAFRN